MSNSNVYLGLDMSKDKGRKEIKKPKQIKAKV